MIKLTKKQLKEKVDFAEHYMQAGNNATKSEVDSNANVSSKNVATLAAELNKDTDVQINRYYLGERIEKLFGKKAKKEYYKSLERHEIYSHDEGSVFNKVYCVAIDLFPFLSNGMISLGGDSKAPKHLASFCGSYINLIFAISSQFAGAVGDSSFLTYFNYFAVKDYGEDYLTTNLLEIENALQHIVYSLNQPASARGFQSVFWNISIFDNNYFDSLFGKLPLPNGENPVWTQVDKLQRFFMNWFNKERTKAVLTFPVITSAYLTENGLAKDVPFKDFLAQEMSEGNSFFHYSSNEVNAISGCCRLRSEIDINQFSYTLGGVGLATGSKKVFTININRMVQDGRDIKTEVENIHKYLLAYNDILYDMKDKGMMPVYDAGYITMDKQYLTIGINGIAEAGEYLGMDISNNETYLSWVQNLLKVISDTNKEGNKKYSTKERKIMFNTEFVPAENLGVKFAKWDKKDGYLVNRDCYNSYLYLVEDTEIDFADKFMMHGADVLQYLDGGSACHQNMNEIPNKETWLKIIDVATKAGSNYWTYNVPATICNECEHISKHNLDKCPKCGSVDVDHLTRIIGYLKRISSFSEARQVEAGKRFYH